MHTLQYVLYVGGKFPCSNAKQYIYYPWILFDILFWKS